MLLLHLALLTRVSAWTSSQLQAAEDCDPNLLPGTQPWQLHVSMHICIAELDSANYINATELLRSYREPRRRRKPSRTSKSRLRQTKGIDDAKYHRDMLESLTRMLADEPMQPRPERAYQQPCDQHMQCPTSYTCRRVLRHECAYGRCRPKEHHICEKTCDPYVGCSISEWPLPKSPTTTTIPRMTTPNKTATSTTTTTTPISTSTTTTTLSATKETMTMQVTSQATSTISYAKSISSTATNSTTTTNRSTTTTTNSTTITTNSTTNTTSSTTTTTTSTSNTPWPTSTTTTTTSWTYPECGAGLYSPTFKRCMCYEWLNMGLDKYGKCTVPNEETTTTEKASDSTTPTTIETSTFQIRPTTIQHRTPVGNTREAIAQPLALLEVTQMSEPATGKVKPDNCKYLRSSTSFSCKNWESNTIMADIRHAKLMRDGQVIPDIEAALPKYGYSLNPTWRNIAAQLLPPFGTEIITRYLFLYCISDQFDRHEDYHYKSRKNRKPTQPSRCSDYEPNARYL